MPPRCLSHRELQVLAALAAGESVQEVAHRCNRSPKTINNQRTAVLQAVLFEADGSDVFHQVYVACALAFYDVSQAY